MYSEKHCQRSEKVRGGVCPCTDALWVCCSFGNIHSGLLEFLRPAVLKFLPAVATPTELRSSLFYQDITVMEGSSCLTHNRKTWVLLHFCLGKSVGADQLDFKLLSISFDYAYKRLIRPPLFLRENFSFNISLALQWNIIFVRKTGSQTSIWHFNQITKVTLLKETLYE